MAKPIVDPESSVLSYPQWLTWEHQFSATNSPYRWDITAGGFPTGMSFQPSMDVAVMNSGDVIDKVAHGLANGTVLVFSALAGGAPLAAATRYFVVNAAADTFQLAAALGGTPIVITTDSTAATVFRPGFLTGFATVPGISTVRLTATNATDTSDEVLFTIGVEPAAAAPDGNTDLVINLATGDVIAQTNSVLNLAPQPRDTPILFVKEQDDMLARIRLVKDTTVILPSAMSVTACLLVLKELEPENKVVLSDAFDQVGTGSGSSILLHTKFDGAALAASLSNYEADGGTFYDALAEIELTYDNPYIAVPLGGASLVRTTKTFRIRIERDLGES